MPIPTSPPAPQAGPRPTPIPLWQAAERIGALIPIRTVTILNEDVCLVPNTGSVVTDRNIQVIAGMTKLLAGFRSMTLPQVRAELIRIAALGVAFVLAAGMAVLVLVVIGGAA
jgi:hypothetical protein